MDPTMAVDKEDATREDPTRELLTAAGGDRCTNCQAPLASDQRYCVNCGERRGKTRVAFAAVASQATPAPAPAGAQPPRQPRAASGINFIAGVATLLLAMGVGVLIGHGIGNNKVTQAAAPTQQVIKVVGGGSGGGGGGSSTGKRRSRRHASNTPAVKLTTKVTKAVNNAASNVLGSGANKLAPATVQPGQTCKAGQSGCQGGKFTGNFFGQ